MSIQPLWWLLAVVAVALIAQVVLGRGQLGAPEFLRRAGITVLLGLVSLQPAWGAVPPQAPPTSADIVVVIDRTTSMGAEDVAGRPRLEAVAADVGRLVRSNPDARYAVVTSDNVARVAVPWTSDTRAVTSFVETVGWREESIGSGTDITAALPVARRLLEDSVAKRPRTERHLIYLGDGEQTSRSEPQSFAPLREFLSQALVFGYGTTAGGPMRPRPGAQEFVTRDGAVQLSRLDEPALQRISAELGGRYEHRGGAGPVPALPGGSAALANADQEPGWQLGWVAGALAACLSGWGLWGATREAARARRETTS